jgi:Sulfotransferase family
VGLAQTLKIRSRQSNHGATGRTGRVGGARRVMAALLGCGASSLVAEGANGEGLVSLDRPGPLFIVGAPRSGTSLLYKLLCLHTEAAWISNWARRAPGLPALAVLNRAAPRFPATRREVWFGADAGNAYVYGKRRTLKERLFPMPVEGEPVYRRCGIGQGPAADPAQLARLRRAFTGVRRWGGGTVLISKRIANNQRIPLLATGFPEARFVHLIRDGRAVAYSLSRVDWWEDGVVWWYGDTPRRWRERGGDPWELVARHWVRELGSIDEGLRVVAPDRRLELHYEELVRAPVPVLRRVARFGGLADDAGWTAELGGLRYPNKNEAWTQRLAPDVRARVEAIQREELRRLGHVG